MSAHDHELEAHPHDHDHHADHTHQDAGLPAVPVTGLLTIDEVRSRLRGQTGKRYWRSLDELAGTPEFDEFLHREFPREASVWDDSLSRRGFLKVMGASLALAGLSACTKQPDEKLVPFVKGNDQYIPGTPISYATAHTVNGYAIGVLATSHAGRPTKLEGNPNHPASQGATDIFTQAAILGLYDPDRSQVAIHDGNISNWEDFTKALVPEMNIQKGLKGATMRILTGTLTSPTMLEQIKSILAAFPEAKWYRYESIDSDGAQEGAVLAFGERVATRYSFDKAKVVLSVDSDFLYSGPAAVRYARDFAKARRVDTLKEEMNRLYVVESAFSLTGSNADHRIGVRPSQIEPFVRALASELGVAGIQPSSTEVSRPWLSALAKDLMANHGRSIVVAGETQSAAVHAIVHLINSQLGNNGATVTFSEPIDTAAGTSASSLRELASEMKSGKVDMLLMLEGNPVYDAPNEVAFAEALKKVRFSVHLGQYEDETSSYSHWHLPSSHFLEGWSDARSYEGTVSVVQPLIEPLYQTKSAHEVLQLIATGQNRNDYDIVQNYWRTKGNFSGSFDIAWRNILNDGFILNSALPAKNVSPRPSAAINAPSTNGDAPGGVEISFRPDPTIGDGRWANNGWLQELPKPLTKLTWDNAVLMSPKDAEAQQLTNGDLVDVSAGGGSVRMPVMILPGQPDGTVTLNIGYGRARTGKTGTGTGFNVNGLRTLSHPWHRTGASIARVGTKYPLSVTQEHFAMEGREPVRGATLEEFLATPDFATKEHPEPPKDMSLYPDHHYEGYAWGMSIDLNACIGCGACTIACQAENNIPVVGKDQVARSREMHWIRVDRYFEGEMEDPSTHFQPVPCMHCENAPCEVVCPVGATQHDEEGLNVMTYNRCVGTKYCSNNCPYKVRRFNFLQYSDETHAVVGLQKNPEVTVRARGVMEKCTYCVQRISSARIAAKRDGHPIQDGDVVTACEAVCPASAIVFGDINDANSNVSKAKAGQRNYGLLAELNTRPRTTYLARVRNPNPEIESMTSHA